MGYKRFKLKISAPSQVAFQVVRETSQALVPLLLARRRTRYGLDPATGNGYNRDSGLWKGI
jgi:hypothetical protein